MVTDGETVLSGYYFVMTVAIMRPLAHFSHHCDVAIDVIATAITYVEITERGNPKKNTCEAPSWE